MWFLGGNIPLQITTYNSSNVATDATTVTLTVTLPDGTSSTPTVTHAATGVYTATGPSTQTGRYTCVWIATGTVADEIEDSYEVRGSSSLWLLSFQDAKAALNMSKSVNDREVMDYLDSVTSLIEDRIGPVIPRTVTEVCEGGQEIRLTYTPVTAITSITGYQAGAWQVVPANIIFDSVTGVVQLFNRVGFYDQYTVVYTAGRGMTGAIRQAARVTLQHLWNSQRNTSQVRDGDAYTAPFSLPNAARELLDPYTTPAVG